MLEHAQNEYIGSENQMSDDTIEAPWNSDMATQISMEQVGERAHAEKQTINKFHLEIGNKQKIQCEKHK